MIVENPLITKQPEVRPIPSDPNGTAGLEELPPSFEQATEDRLLPDPPQQDPPPPFSDYEPTFLVNENGAVTSHDPHLNKSGEALYRFLLAQSSTPPTYHLHISGSHIETRTHIVNDHDHHRSGNGLRHRRHERNGTEAETETSTEVVIDFDFRIDLTPNITRDSAHSPVQWSVPDDDPAYRGKVHQQVEVPATRGGETMRTPDSNECEEYELWCRERDSSGQPPWTGFSSRHNPSTSGNPPPGGETQPRSSRTVRQWCDDYCASEKLLKEFIYTKLVYGWDFHALKRAIETTVKQTSYTGTLVVKFSPVPSTNNLIIVRPANTIANLFFDPELKVILWITFIYPLIWLFQQFHSHGGGIWKTCGGGYPLKVVLPPSRNVGDPDGASGSSSSAYAREMTYVIGEREGEWFKKWENTIRCAVSSRTQDNIPLVYPTNGPYVNPSAALLDGYRG